MNKHIQDTHRALRERAAEHLREYQERTAGSGFERSAAMHRGLYLGTRLAINSVRLAMQRDKYDSAIADLEGLAK
jgi:hypothetical protein